MLRLIAENSPDAVSSTKELLQSTDGLSLQEALQVAAVRNTLSRYSPDFDEGITSFFEKRKADFSKGH
jgi:enoyl-CoA hydratase/carnithine racemase